MESVSDLSQFGGQQAGTSGSEQAVAYISQRLPQSRLQSFPVTAIHVEPPVRVVVDAETGGQVFHAGQDFLPILNAMGADIVSARVMFVGYGISDRAGGLDEYADLSARGKVVLFLRGQPKNYAGRVTQQEKVKAAKAHGAVGYLMATGPSLSAYERRRGMGQNPMAFYDESAENLPGLWIAPHMAERLLPNGVTRLRCGTESMLRPARDPFHDDRRVLAHAVPSPHTQVRGGPATWPAPSARPNGPGSFASAHGRQGIDDGVAVEAVERGRSLVHSFQQHQCLL